MKYVNFEKYGNVKTNNEKRAMLKTMLLEQFRAPYYDKINDKSYDEFFKKEPEGHIKNLFDKEVNDIKEREETLRKNVKNICEHTNSSLSGLDEKEISEACVLLSKDEHDFLLARIVPKIDKTKTVVKGDVHFLSLSTQTDEDGDEIKLSRRTVIQDLKFQGISKLINFVVKNFDGMESCAEVDKKIDELIEQGTYKKETDFLNQVETSVNYEIGEE